MITRSGFTLELPESDTIAGQPDVRSGYLYDSDTIHLLNLNFCL